MNLIGGIDEVGRGCLFGSVVASVVIVTPDQTQKLAKLGVKDSKQLSAKKREILTPSIKTLVTDWAIASASVEEIDELNILQATFLAMRRAVAQLNIQAEHYLVDGKQTIPDLGYSQQAIVKGDSHAPAIAAASILAKVHRDAEIIQLADQYPQYDLAANKGYGTRKHRLAIAQHGRTPYHRQSFRLTAVAR